MSISESRLAYTDCYTVLDAALADAQGVRVLMPSHDSAIYLRMRIHQARKIDRKGNMVTYEKGHPMHGTSVYDPLIVQIKTIEGTVYLYVSRIGIDVGTIESLTGLPAPEPVAQIEAPEAEFEEVEPQKQIGFTKRF